MAFIKSFLWGSAAVLMALVLQQVVFVMTQIMQPSPTPVLHSYETLTPFLIVAIVIEEGLKYVVIIRTMRTAFLTHALLVGAGFAFVEITLQFFTQTVSGINLLRPDIIGLFILHMTTAVLIARLVLLAQRYTITPTIGIILAASILHGLYNYAILQSTPSHIFLPVLLMSGFFLFLLFSFRNVDKK